MAVYAWGAGGAGQLGCGGAESAFSPVECRPGRNGERAASVSAGGGFTAVVTSKGDVRLCGCAKYGRLGTGHQTNVATPTKILVGKDAKVLQAAAGSWHACAVTFLGRLYSWGYNSKHNVLGRHTDKTSNLVPGLVASLMGVKVKEVSCGHNFTLLCTTDGHVYSWGNGRHGVLGHGFQQSVTEPKRVMALNRVRIVAVNAGYTHCGAISDDGRLYMFGKGGDGALGFGAHQLDNKTEPTWLSTLLPMHMTVVRCSVGDQFSYTIALSSTGVAFAWGSNHRGQLGLGDRERRTAPTRIAKTHFDGLPVTAISAGATHSAAISSDGKVYTWGCSQNGCLGHSETAARAHSYCCTSPKLVATLLNEMLKTGRVASQIACSSQHTVVLLEYPSSAVTA